MDRDLYVGGVENIEDGLVVYENFNGCIENMYLNHSNIIRSFTNRFLYDDGHYQYEDIGGGVVKGCQPEYFSIPVTFKNSKSFAKLTLKGKFWHFLTPLHYTNSQNSIIYFEYVDF